MMHESQLLSPLLLTYDGVEHSVGGIIRRYLVFGIEYPKLGRVLKWVNLEAQLVEEAAEGPDVRLLVHWFVAVEVNHLRGTIHGRRVALNLNIIIHVNIHVRTMSESK